MHTGAGRTLAYDALLLAVGGRLGVPFEHVTVFDDAHADETFHGLVQDVEGGYTRSVALVLPEGPTWPLPAAFAGMEVEREPLRPVIRGILHTGAAPLYLTTRLEGSRVVESEATTDAAWPTDDKVVAEELPDFHRSL